MTKEQIEKQVECMLERYHNMDNDGKRIAVQSGLLPASFLDIK